MILIMAESHIYQCRHLPPHGAVLSSTVHDRRPVCQDVEPGNQEDRDGQWRYVGCRASSKSEFDKRDTVQFYTKRFDSHENRFHHGL